jgi:hypothetical protein
MLTIFTATGGKFHGFGIKWFLIFSIVANIIPSDLQITISTEKYVEDQNLNKIHMFNTPKEHTNQKLISAKVKRKVKNHRKSPENLMWERANSKIKEYGPYGILSFSSIILLTILIDRYTTSSIPKQTVVQEKEEETIILQPYQELSSQELFKASFINNFDPKKFNKKKTIPLISKSYCLDYYKDRAVKEVPQFNQLMLESLFLSSDKQLVLTDSFKALFKKLNIANCANNAQSREQLKKVIKSVKIDKIILYALNQVIAMPLTNKDFDTLGIEKIKKISIDYINEFCDVSKFIFEIVFYVFGAKDSKKSVDSMYTASNNMLETLKVIIFDRIKQYTRGEFDMVINAKNIKEIMGQKSSGKNNTAEILKIFIAEQFKAQIENLKFMDEHVPIFSTLQSLFIFLFGADYNSQVFRPGSDFDKTVNVLRKVIMELIDEGQPKENQAKESHISNYYKKLQNYGTWEKIYQKIQSQDPIQWDARVQFLVKIFASCFVKENESNSNSLVNNIKKIGLEILKETKSKNQMEELNMIFPTKDDNKNIELLIKNARLLFFHIINQQTQKIQANKK